MAMTTVLIVFLMLGCWALISSGQLWGARRDAQAVAAAAARAGAEIDGAELRDAGRLDPAAAARRAQAVLAASGCAGSVRVDGQTVTVSATRSVDYAFPAPGFAGAVTGQASADAMAGVQGDEGG